MPPNNRAPKRGRIRSAHVDSTASSSTRKVTRPQHPRIQAPREVQRRLTWVSQRKNPHLYQLIVNRQKRLKERGSRAAKEDFYCPVLECTWNVGRDTKTTKASNVRDHLEKHIQEKPAMCSGCGARFSSIGNCTRHIECHRFKNDPICGTAEVIEPAET
ncbi:hypothetical protein BDN72DRAFT_849905 [Pluteus cervinus]|uniref:Uncharacterized protein n=1 Tax=Pluteus cervinus TaxID=181527 RepID=A0ACD3A719_9AGAR|nr:hypothetical protein BDN72DRAFT_849905 [Pluteus cervinus]